MPVSDVRNVFAPGLLPIILCVLVLSLTAPLTAQVITFRRAYGGWSWDEGYSVAQTTDGGYIITSITYSFGGGHGDVWLIKTNAFGDTMWTRTYDGGTTDDCGYSVAQTADGGYVVAGVTKPFGAGLYDVYLVKTDASGDTTWTRTWGGTGYDDGNSVLQTADGGYVIAGYTWSFGAGREDVWLIKTNATGDTMWTRTYGGTGDDWGGSVAQTVDGGYVIVGWTGSFSVGSGDVWLIRTDADGNSTIAKAELPAAYKPAAATIARAVLYVPETETTNARYPITLLDVAGRKAMDLRPGPNDVRHLSPGVYFVREASGVEHQASRVRKVIITH